MTDDQGIAVTCPGTELEGGESMTCTGAGTAQLGQYANIGTVVASLPDESTSTDSDPSHYFGQAPFDFGDAADPTYPTNLASNGARHRLGSNVYLGACVDSELDGQPNAGSTGDDTTVGIQTFGTCAVPGNDEDGVVFTTPLIPGTTAGIDVTANSSCILSAWIDFNANGSWADPADDLFPGGVTLAAGINPLVFTVPPDAVLGVRAARFRCTTAGALGVTGEAEDGEVEDYVVTIGPPAVSATKTAALLIDQNNDGLADPGDTLAYTVVLQNSGGAPAAGLNFTDTPDANTALVNGSVSTTAGTITSGNGAGETSVGVEVGTLAGAGDTATIVFNVTINDPLPFGVTKVANQGLVSGDLIADTLTDDPAQPGATDPTRVAVTATQPIAIPTLSAWALLLFLMLLGLLGFRRLLIETR